MAEQNYIEEIKEVWEMVKTSLNDKFSETAVNLWLGDARILSFETDVITMGIDSELKFKIVQEKYIPEIEGAFCRLLGYEIRVQLVFTGSSVNADRISSESTAKKEEPQPQKQASLLPTYNFEYTLNDTGNIGMQCGGTAFGYIKIFKQKNGINLKFFAI